MQWHWHEWPSLLHHLPHSVTDLLHREDKQLVDVGIGGFTVAVPKEDQKHKLIIPEAPDIVAIEKAIDPAVARSQQNMELLIHDYLHTLPVYVPSSKAAEQLLEHWRKIMLEQPQRIAEAKEAFWNSEKAKAYWQERLKHIHPDHIVYQGDWELAAGTPVPPPEIQSAMQQKKWQDLVIRQRLSAVTEYFNRTR